MQATGPNYYNEKDTVAKNIAEDKLRKLNEENNKE